MQQSCSLATRYGALAVMIVAALHATQVAMAQCGPLELSRLLAAMQAPGDRFGDSVAISGDTAVVGAPHDNNANGNHAGAAYVFVRSNGNWIEQAKLVAADPQGAFAFGTSVANSGETIIVGAPGNNNPGGIGSAYVFVRAGAAWMQQARLEATPALSGNEFGVAVALDGDTAVIGAYGEFHSGGGQAGAAYVFVRANGLWTQQARILAEDAAWGDQFGYSVSLVADDVLIGAPGDDAVDGSHASEGSAYLFQRTGSVWMQTAKLTADDAAADDAFGYSVALSADSALVGAPSDNHSGGQEAGSAYVFVRNGGAWTQQTRLTSLDTAASELFGYSVALAGDTALIGAAWTDLGEYYNAGAAYVFDRAGSVWAQRAKLVASEPGPLDQFGTSVALGADTILVGAVFNQILGGQKTNAVSVFSPHPICAGDMDASGAVGVGDIPGFVQVLVAGPGSPQQLQDADMDCNGLSNGLDIQIFVAKVLAGGDCL